MSVLLEVSEAESAAKKNAQQDYADVVIRLAAGNDDPTLAEVQEALAAIGKSTDDLRGDVSERHQRDAERAKVHAAENCVAEREQLTAQLDAAEVKLEGAREHHRQTVSPIVQRIAEIDGLALAATYARSQLQRTCSDPAIVEGIADVRSQLARVDTAIHKARHTDDHGRLESLQQEKQLLVAEMDELFDAAIWA